MDLKEAIGHIAHEADRRGRLAKEEAEALDPMVDFIPTDKLFKLAQRQAEQAGYVQGLLHALRILDGVQ